MPTRQRSLRATLDWSHSLLGPTEQQVLRRLSVFVGASGSSMRSRSCPRRTRSTSGTVLEALRTLVDRSLVQVEPTQPPRYRLLESVRLYAAEQLAAAGETEAVELRHGEAFARLAVTLRDDYRALSHPEFLELYAADEADMDAAFDRACERKDAATGAVTGAALVYFAAAFGVNTEMRRLQKAAYDLLPAAQDPLDRALLWRQVATAIVDRRSAGAASARRPRCVQAWRAVGDTSASDVALAQRRSRARAIEDPPGAATAFDRHATRLRHRELFGDVRSAESVRRRFAWPSRRAIRAT